eukprot:g8280.t1
MAARRHASSHSKVEVEVAREEHAENSRQWHHPGGPARRFLSHLLTYPLTLASGVREAGVEGVPAPMAPSAQKGHVSPGGLGESDRSDSDGTCDSDKSSALAVVCLGARAESTMPPSFWLETLFALPGFSRISLHLIGPELGVPPGVAAGRGEGATTTARGDESGRERRAGLSSTATHATVLSIGERTLEVGWTRAMLGRAAAAGEEGQRVVGAAAGETAAAERAVADADAFVLFNPGLGHPHLREGWAEALERLLDTGKPIIVSCHSEKDLERDARLLREAGAVRCCTEQATAAAAGGGGDIFPRKNAFRSLMASEDPLSAPGQEELVSCNWGVVLVRAIEGRVMKSSGDGPAPSWLVQEPEGHGAPKTPGRWKTLWASDCARLEEAHQRGDKEVLVYGRKYVVDMKERTMKPLYWEEEWASKPIIRATYFLRKGHGWLPYCEKDSELLEVAYAAAKVQLRSNTCNESEIPLTDGENKVVMTKVNAGESANEYFADFDILLQQKPVKAPSRLATTFYTTTFEVHRGSPEVGGWGGVSATEGDLPLEGEPPKHLVFIIHGIGESLWSRSSSVLASLRASMGPMRSMSADFLEGQRKAHELEKAAAEAAAAVAAAAQAATGVEAAPVANSKSKETKCGDMGEKGPGYEGAKGEDLAEGKAGEGDGGQPAAGEGEGSGGYVEFLPVEWFNQVHGHDAVGEGLMQDITLSSIPGFRDFANQAIMDVMYYLTPDMQASILSVVGNKMNSMWHDFSRFTPGFSGKVSVMGHSLGSIIAHDILMAQPAKGETELAEGAVSKEIPILSFHPEVLLACGSPIGMFLALRQSTLDKKKLFKFNTTKRFFNLFHLFDPVAYRLEPLLDKRLRNLQPEHVPHRGGDRLHVSVKKFNRGVNEALDRLTKSTGAGWHTIQSSINTTIKSAIGDAGTMNKEPIAREEVSDAREQLAERIDWVIQESTFEGMHPWASAVFAHSSYFSNFDMIMFLVNRLNEGLEVEEDGEGEEQEETEQKQGRLERGKAGEETRAKEESSGVAVEGLVVA